jgi:cyclohexanecarboxylate-CoA ligase
MTKGAGRHGTDWQVFVDEHGRRSSSLGELHEQALPVATALIDAGIGPGDTVAVHMAHVPEALISYLAVAATGAVLVPIPSIYSDREARFILSDCRARMLITAATWRGHEYLSAIPRYLDDGLEQVVVAGGAGHGYQPFTELQATAARPMPPLPPPTGEDPAAIIYTSGSTSDPKGVVHSDDTLAFEVKQNYPLERMAGSIWLNAAPAGHMGGFLSALKMLMLGGPGVWMERWDPDLAVSLVQEFSVTGATLVPFHLMTVLEAMERAGVDRLGLRDVLCGSTTVPTVLIEDAAVHGIGAYRCYGSTEHPTISKSSPRQPLAERSLTDGAVLTDLTVRIVDDSGADVPEGAEGEIISTGPDLFLGYTRAEENAAAFTADGYFRTGDLGQLTGGILTITGRKKEVIIRGGENISVREVEELLLRHPAVYDVAVVPRSHDRYGEQVWAFVRTRGNVPVTLGDIQQHFRELGVARQKTPEGVVVLEEFPRTAAGKISKRDLRATLPGTPVPGARRS